MKRSLLAGLGLVALIAVPAAAADLPRQAPAYRAPAAVSVFNWTGAYAGLHGGYSWSGGRDIELRGGFFGGQLGYNWQGVGSPWVLGLEVDSAWASLGSTQSGVVPPVGFLSFSTKAHYQGSLRARIGYAFEPRTMVYATGGLGWVHNKVTWNAPIALAGVSAKATHWGGVVGAGVEHAFAPQLTGKIEYLYAGYGAKDYFGPGFSLNAASHSVKVGFNYLIR